MANTYHGQLVREFPTRKIGLLDNGLEIDNRIETLNNLLAQRLDAIVTSNILSRHVRLPFIKTILNDEMPKYHLLAHRTDDAANGMPNNENEYDVSKYAYRASRLGTSSGNVLTIAASNNVTTVVKQEIEKKLSITVEIKNSQ